MLEIPEYLEALSVVPGLRFGWAPRIPGVDSVGTRDEVMCRLGPVHERAVREMAGERPYDWWRAEQVHGGDVAVVPGAATVIHADGREVVPGVDGLVSSRDGVLLTIYVADCGVIWLADRKTRAIGLLHSGRKGTEANVLGRAVDVMAGEFGTNPADLVAVLGPCIRPPDYEVDFAGEIARQAGMAGIGNFIDSGVNTACDPVRHYSYRKESGRTGRMMALLYRETE